MRRTIHFLQGTFVLTGMIIGVGIFGIPFSFARAGYSIGLLELIFLTGIILLYHLLYGEVVLNTSSFHRMPGYVRMYLGKRFAALDWCIAILGVTGSLLAYVLLGSFFLHSILSLWLNVPQSFSFALFLFAGAFVNALPLKKEVSISNIFTTLLFGLIILLIVLLLPLVSAKNLVEIHLEQSFLPYGLLLFALSGGVVIPDLVTFLGRARTRVRYAIALGTLIPAILYGFFSLAVVGSLGRLTTKEAISGLLPLVGPHVVFLGNSIGLFATFNAFITLSESFESLLHIDLGFSRFDARILIIGVPALFYLGGFNNFLGIMGAVGALGVGIESLLVVMMYHIIQKRHYRTLPLSSYVWKMFVYAVILGGVVGEVWHLIWA